MERALNGTRQLLAVVISCCLCFSLSAAQLSLATHDAASIKDLNELGSHYLPAGYAAIQPNVTLDDLQRLMEQKCLKANAPLPASEVNATKLTADIQQAAGRLMQCINGLVNISVVMDEVETARPRGDLDVVFEKYCLRMPRARECITDFNAALLPCMTREERSHNAMMLRIMGKLLDFVCYKNGDQIALFIAEEGPECFQQHKDNVGSCLQTSFGHYLPSQLNISQVQLPDLVLGPRQCTELHDFESCVVRHLETCSNITPSNIVESMFRYVRKESNCQQVIDRVTRESNEALAQRSGAASTWSASLTIAALAVRVASAYIL
ncbi:27 kDa glycoprotein [Drosophila grimshawi]|uniref:GH11994 n=1 Tax=Drosophila grimshawi TaxID=7222 RepID=B4JKU0_DROGR|nr:27 kDa glycoprotein [Drosophila grimshawi]EDW00193.1 GH11994 [Drosophila grimshawi]